jgi:hypothetical protein
LNSKALVALLSNPDLTRSKLEEIVDWLDYADKLEKSFPGTDTRSKREAAAAIRDLGFGPEEPNPGTRIGEVTSKTLEFC